MEQILKRGTGVLLIDVTNSNPNGDPDMDSDPRIRQDGRGEISPVSFKRKIRNLIEDKSTELWKDIAAEMNLSEAAFGILESKDTKRSEIKEMTQEEFLSRYWDARVFGSTFLDEKREDKSFITTGVVQFGLGVSLDPVQIERMTTTKVMAVDESKGKGMAPLAFRIVSYGLYIMPFFINATAAAKTHCTAKDIELLFRLIPYAYPETASYIRPQVFIRHAFYVEHGKARGTVNDFHIIEALTPRKINDVQGPAASWKDYDESALMKNVENLNKQIEGKASPVKDLVMF